MATETPLDPTADGRSRSSNGGISAANALAAVPVQDAVVTITGSESNRWSKNGYGEPVGQVGGKFTKEESELVRSAIEEYCAAKKITPARLCSECDHKAELKGAWMEIARRLPHRTVQSVYRHGLRQLHPFKRGPWAEEEVNALMELVNRYGKKWSGIQAKLNRTADSCRDKHREMSSEFVKGRWKDNETECLKRLIREHLRADPSADIVQLAKMVERENIVLPWSTISKKMGKRSRLSCFKKWQKMTGLGDEKKGGPSDGKSKGGAANGAGAAVPVVSGAAATVSAAINPVQAAAPVKQEARQIRQSQPPAAAAIESGAANAATAAAVAAIAVTTATTGLTPNPIATAAAVEAGADVDQAAVDATSAAQIAAETVEAVDLPVIQTPSASGPAAAAAASPDEVVEEV